MKKEKIKRISNLNIIIACTFLILFIFISTFGVTSSRYVEQLQTNGTDVVAIPVLSLSNDLAKYQLSNMMPGDTRSFDFQVSNTQNGIINEVLLNYTLNITLDTEVPLTLTLFDVTSGTEVAVPLTANKTSVMEMNYGKTETKTYRLKLTWDKNNNDVKYAEKSVSCTVNLKGEQVIK